MRNLAWVLVLVTGSVVWGQAQPPRAEGARVGWMEIADAMADYTPRMSWASTGEMLSLRGVLEQLQTVASDDAFRGVTIHLDQADLTLAQIAEIDQGIAKVRAAGKKVLVYSEAYDLRSYLLACSADRVLLLKKGTLELAGLGMEEMYLAGLMEKVGVKADLMQVGKFKGAAEPLTGSAPSAEWSQNIDALLDDAYDQMLQRIATARNLKREQVEAALRDCWTMSDKDYVKRGLIDELVDRDLVSATDAAFGEDFEWDTEMGRASVNPQMDNPFVMFRMLFQGVKQEVRRPSIAVVHAYGEIHSGPSSSAGSPRAGLFSSDSIGSRTIVETLGEAADNDMIKGVVLRIDSPGGSALASEVMWQAIRELADQKPVFVSIGDVAASGGYYMACAGTRIYVSPTSIVGSIGVVGGKIVLGGLYEKIGVSVHRRTRGPMGDMFNSVSPFGPEERAAVQSSMQRTYEQFTDRVTTGRGRKIADVQAVAQGRVFTGRQAVLNGLADQLGGVEIAVADLAGELGLAPGSYDLVDLPEPPSLAEYLEQVFGGVSAPGIEMTVAQQLMGPAGWAQASSTLEGLLLLHRERTLTLLPVMLRLR